MSTIREQTSRADDRLVTAELAPDQAEAVAELRAELANDRRRGKLQMVARETLEAVALGG
jgi:hypothetical protein